MSPIDWALSPLKKYATFSGRAPRAEYWWFYLLVIVAYLIAMVVDSLIGIGMFGPYGLVTCVVILALLIPSLAAGVRRLHDSNRTGWWMAGPVIPYAIGIAMMGPAMLDPAAVRTGGSMASLGGAMIFLLIGFIMAIVIFVFLVLPGTVGPNNYGEDPYDRSGQRAM